MTEDWLVRRKSDHYYRKAKAERYRARSAYKLLDIQKTFHLIKKGDIVVDLGAAPGSWSQVALDFVGETGKVIGVDVKTVSGLDDRFVFVLGDITKMRTIDRLREFAPRADVVLSDVSPEFSGIRSKDMGLAIDFSFQSLVIAASLLREKGHFVVKAFRGPGYDKFVAEIRKCFEVVKEVKPEASQKKSAEMYIVGLKFKKGIQPLAQIE